MYCEGWELKGRLHVPALRKGIGMRSSELEGSVHGWGRGKDVFSAWP